MSDLESRPARVSDYLKEMKESVAVLRWIWSELIIEQGKKYALRMLGLMVLTSILAALQPLAFANILNHIHDPSWSFVAWTFTALFGIALLHQLSQLGQEVTREMAWNRTIFGIYARVNQLFSGKTLGQHAEEGTKLNQSTIERGQGRILTIQEMILFETSAMVIYLAFAYLLLWTISWKVGLVATFLICIHLAWSLYLNFYVARDTDEIEQAFRAHGHQMTDRWGKIARVKTSGKTTAEHNRLFEWFEDTLHKDFRFWGAFFTPRGKLRDVVILVGRMCIIGYGLYLVRTGEWKLGMLLPLYAWITDLCQNLGWIGHAERRINQQVPYIKAMRDALMSPPSFRDDEGAELPKQEAIHIAFDNVGLSYGEGAHPILEGISFEIQPGDKVALLGPSGAGKSSIMKLLLRFTDPSTGEIRVNGMPLTGIKHQSWMEQVGNIPQEAQVFDGTIRYNLTFGLSPEEEAAITDDEIWHVMRQLQIDFGKRLTHGLDTLVGKDGVQLSGGQKQRLMIGAAAIKRPRFMIIDEATSSLDSCTEHLVQQGLEQVLAGTAGALIVAHRLATVRSMCNRFMVLRPLEDVALGEPQIEAEANSFEELFERSPTFRKLAERQHVYV